MNKVMITSFLGKEINLIDIDSSQITLEDIAHGLSYLCRYSGQCRHFYSVGQHSINCLKVSDVFGYDEKLKIYTLLHDASEAYICDIPSPLKRLLPEYKKYEISLQDAIYERFNLEKITPTDKRLVKQVDNIMFSKEWKELMDPNHEDQYTELSIPNLDFTYQSMKIVEEEFLKETKRLIKNRIEG